MFVARLAGTGGVAGVLAWILGYVLRRLLDGEPLGTTVLFFAVLRGAALGTILALVLAAYWERAPRGR